MISLAELRAHASGFFDDATRLVRAEGALIRAEIEEKIADAQRGIMSLAVGALIAFVGVIFLGHAAAAWLATMIGAPLAYLVIAVILIIFAAISLASARSNLSKENLKPDQTIETFTHASDRLKGDHS